MLVLTRYRQGYNPCFGLWRLPITRARTLTPHET